MTTSLGLVFGPWDPFVTESRIAIAVGSEFPIPVADPDAPWLFWSYFVSSRDELVHARPEPRQVMRTKSTIEIEGSDVELDTLRREDR